MPSRAMARAMAARIVADGGGLQRLCADCKNPINSAESHPNKTGIGRINQFYLTEERWVCPRCDSLRRGGQ